VLALSVALASTLAGCASSPGSASADDSDVAPVVSITEAKTATLSIEKDIASYVPSASVTDTQQTTTSKVIFPCLGHSDESYWPGTLTLLLKKGVDTDAVLGAILTAYLDKPGWDIVKKEGVDGDDTLQMKSKDGYSFVVGFSGGPQFTISALSACFPNSGLSGKSSY
jgi:hypothetical protein